MSEVEEQLLDDIEVIEDPQKGFLPGGIFYTERVEFPAAISAHEAESVIETLLEAHAPFPLEQLNFGAVCDRSTSEAFVYAALRDQLEPADVEMDLNDPHFPCFLPFLQFRGDQPCILTAVTGSQLALLVFDKADSLPSEVHCISMEGDSHDDSYIEKIRADLLRDLPWIQLPLHSELFRWDHVEQNWKNEQTFVAVGSEQSELRMTLSAIDVSLADVRDRELKEDSLNSAKWNQKLWLTTLISVAGLGVVGLLAVVNWIWSIGIDSKTELVAERQAQVDAIEAKERNLQVFESGSAAQLQPLAMLDIINRVRPDGVYFGEVRAFEGSKLQVDGMAENDGAGLINQFRDELNKLAVLESVSVEITRINQGVTYFFRANLEFKELQLADVGSH